MAGRPFTWPHKHPSRVRGIGSHNLLTSSLESQKGRGIEQIFFCLGEWARYVVRRYFHPHWIVTCSEKWVHLFTVGLYAVTADVNHYQLVLAMKEMLCQPCACWVTSTLTLPAGYLILLEFTVHCASHHLSLPTRLPTTHATHPTRARFSGQVQLVWLVIAETPVVRLQTLYIQ